MFPAFEKYRIVTLSALILVTLTLAAGISVFVVMQRQAEFLLSEKIELLLQRNEQIFQSEIEQALSNTRAAASRPFLIQNLQLLASKPDNASGLTNLQRTARSLLPTDFTGMSLYDVRGHEVVREGRFSQKHELRVPLKSNIHAALLWDEGFILQASADVLDQQGRRIGRVMTEAKLLASTEAFAAIAAIGKTAEFVVCAPLADDEKNTDCFMSRFSEKVFKRFPRVLDGKPLPMNYALNGETGIIFAGDYRREPVAAAYTPMGPLGLGMVIKIDRAELYQPVLEQLKFIALVLAALVMVGMLLLNFLVKPIVRKLVDSERATRAANTRLSESEQRLRIIIETEPECVKVVSPQGRLLEMNAAGLAMLEAESLGEAQHGFLMDFILPEYRDAFRALHSRVMHGESGTLEFEVRGLRGTRRWLETHAAPMRDAVNKVVSLLGVTRDISARKQAEEEVRQLNLNLEQRVQERTTELQAANQELEAFSYSVSHDLRAPLRAIDGFSQAVLEDYADKLDDQGRDYLNRVRRATQRMGHLIDDMLALSRVTRAEMRRGTVDLSALAADVQAELQKSEPLRRVDWHIESGLVAEGDANLLRVVLDNLLGNAWKFTSKTANAQIELGALNNAESAPGFFVRDNGAGYDMAYADKLFGAFQRLHLASDFTGTGIGLATVQRIVHRHGGRLWAEGFVGKGATFYFTL